MVQHIASMTTRQSIVFFAVGTLKSVDDHCNWVLPWDPVQFFCRSGLRGHDYHHSLRGLKKNYSQFVFSHWNRVMGTLASDAEMEAEMRRKLKRE